MKRAKAYSTVSWRKYLDVDVNLRAKAFLDSRGDDVLWQISTQIHKAANHNLNEVVFLVHPNVGSVIKITKDEYSEFLNIALEWFLKKENYTRCYELQKYKSSILLFKNKTSIQKKHTQTII